jgi:hypothetical protein
MIEIVRIFMRNNPTATCPRVVKHVSEMTGILISRQLAHLILKKRLGLTYKRTRKRGRSKRKDGFDFTSFFQSFEAAILSNSLVAIDESGFDQRSTAIYAYSPKGTPAILEWKTCTDHRHYNLLMSIHQNGKLDKSLSSTSINGETFAEYLRGLEYPSGTTFLLDNASIHKTRRVREICQEFLRSSFCVTAEIFMQHAPESKFQIPHKSCAENICAPPAPPPSKLLRRAN